MSIAVIPVTPREGEPIIAIFQLNNPSSYDLVTRYRFYANGQLLKEGATTIAPGSAKNYKYAHANPLRMGERLNFVVRTQSEHGDHEKVFSLPPYPPQVWSSFVSFASLSTSVMSSMSTMTYYQSSFGDNEEFSVSIVTSLVLIAILIFLELTQPVVERKAALTLERLRIRFSTVSWILLIIFVGMVYTKLIVIVVT
ncbi:MAG: hypothetical protein ACE5IA_01750 [Dehalococcoidia bacterium]